MIEFMARPYRLRMNLQLFAGDGGGSGGSGGDGGGSGGSGSDGGGAGGDGEKKFTQAEVDAMMGQRVPRAEKAAQKALAKELGYDSVDAMLVALKKPEGGNKSGDGATLTMDDVEKRAKELLEASQKDIADKTFKRLLAAEVKVLANELGFADWEDAHALADLSKVKEDDKGNLTGVKEALEELLKKKPHLGKQKPGGTFGADTRGGTPDDKKKSLEKYAEIAKKEGTHAAAPNDPWSRK